MSRGRSFVEITVAGRRWCVHTGPENDVTCLASGKAKTWRGARAQARFVRRAILRATRERYGVEGMLRAAREGKAGEAVVEAAGEAGRICRAPDVPGLNQKEGKANQKETR